MKPYAFALVIIAAASMAGIASASSYLRVVEPFNSTLHNGGSIYLGNDGPGQPFFINALANTTNSTGVLIYKGWSFMNVTGEPYGWIVTNSSKYEYLMSVEVTPSPNAKPGIYAFNVTAVNVGNYSKLGIVRFTAYVNITPNVFKLSVSPKAISSGPGQPKSVYITINNTGVLDSPFEIYAMGLPAFNRSLEVIALHHTSREFTYQVFENEPGLYKATMYVDSVDSPQVHEEANITLSVKASIQNDYNALGYGSNAFPIIYEPAYAVMYFINLIAKHI
ncbi:MAG: hypothetical protein QXJ35_03450 [Candidatus Micrarchaeaceae archaeon]